MVEKRRTGVGGVGRWQIKKKKKECELPTGRCSEDLNIRTETGEQFGKHQLCW